MKYYQKCVKVVCNYFKNYSASGGLCPQTPYRGSAPGPAGDSRPQTLCGPPHPKPPSATIADAVIAKLLYCAPA